MNKLDHQYQSLLKDILENGVEKEDRTGTGTISVFGRQLRHKMSEGFPLLTTKRLYFKGIITELLWFLRGETNIKYLIDNGCNIWNGDAYKAYLQRHNSKDGEGLFTKEEFVHYIKNREAPHPSIGELGPIYGHQWRSWGGRKTDGFIEYEANNFDENIKGIDQIQTIINELKENPDSRRLMVNSWNAADLDQMVLPPCHYGFQIYTRELKGEERAEYFNNKPESWADNEICNVPKRAISLMFNMRSNDVPLGLPFNLASYGLLLEIIAKMVNMVPDELIVNLGDAHIYKNQIDGVKEQLTREPYALPKLNINTEWWPTESGECGVGPIDIHAVLNGFLDDDFCKYLMEDDIQLDNYKHHPTIKMPLSN